MPMIDLTGRKYGRWSVIGLSHRAPGSVLYWKCRCDCGVDRAVFGGDLKRGSSTNCGCEANEARVSRLTTHGMTDHPAHHCYGTMKERCLNEKNPGFHLYGGRGIRICDRWLASFENFWADMGATWQAGLSIERDDNSGNYEPGNCRWATPQEQAWNRRTNRIINTPEGPMPVSQAAEKFGLNKVTVHSRIRYGWPEDELLKPVGSRRSRAA